MPPSGRSKMVRKPASRYRLLSLLQGQCHLLVLVGRLKRKYLRMLLL